MRIRGGALVAALALVGAPVAAWAQEVMPGGAGPGSYGSAEPEATTPERISVLQRGRPDYNALGIRAGSFLVYPALDLGEFYDSNVYAIPSGVKSDFYTDVAPSVNVASNWNTNALNFFAGGDIKRYSQLVSENVSNADVASTGRIDILRDIYLVGGLSYRLAHEDRSSPNSIVGQAHPTQYQVAGIGLGYVHEPGRLGLRIDGLTNFYSYDNAQTATGTTIDETDRNRIEYSLKPRLQYEIVPGYHAFVQASGNGVTYQANRDQFGYQRDSSGWEADAGTAVEITRIISGEVFAGYLEQSYTDPRLRPVSGVGFGGNLLWNVTDLDSVRFTLSRTVQETIVNNVVGTTVEDASSDLQTSAGVSVEHELLRNVLLNVGATYVEDDFEGIVRTDNTYEANAGARYLLTRVWSAGLDFSYRKRDSNQPVNNYEREIVTARLRTQF